MIENIRKYTGLMMVVLVILFFSFLFLDSRSVRNGMAGGHDVIRIADRTYSDKEYKTLGAAAFELTSGLAQAGDFGLYQFLMSTATGATSKDDAAEKFFVGRMILRQAKEEFGIHAGDEEIANYIKSMRAFAGPDGKFNQDTYRNYIEKGIGRLGLTENDLRELASDVLASKKINAIVGSGLAVDRDAVAKNLALENQKITGDLARLDLAPFEEKIKPTDEEIKTYWETIQDAFTTSPQRKFTYVIVTPNLPAETADKADAPESIADATASEEVKKAAQKKKDEEKAKRSAALAEERRKKQLETDTQVSNFFDKLMDQKGAGFEEIAKENNWEVKTTELFAQATPPKELDINLRASSKGGKAVEELFKILVTSDAFSKISEPLAVGENQWLIARLDGEEKSRTKTFEEARNDARAQYISEKAAEAMKTAANEAGTKIKALVTGGKSFAEAAKEAGITAETKHFDSVISTYRPDGATEPQNLFTAAKNIDPGSIADVIIESDRAFILYVAKREVVKEADADKRLDAEVTSRASENETIAFMSWMNARIEAAKVEELVKLR